MISKELNNMTKLKIQYRCKNCGCIMSDTECSGYGYTCGDCRGSDLEKIQIEVSSDKGY